MALRERGRLKRITASGGGTLEAPSHESFRVRALYCVPSASDTYLTAVIQGVTVGKFRVKGLTGNHCPYPTVLTTEPYEALPGNLFEALRARGIELGFPIGSGETLTVTRFAEAGELTIVYDAYDAGDVAANEPNGSRASSRTYLHYITNSIAIATSPADLDSSAIWTGMDSWPVAGKQVAHNARFRLLGILGCPVAYGTGAAHDGHTTHLKLMREGDVMLDDEQNGIPFVGDVSVTGAAADYTPIASAVGPQTAEYVYPGFYFEDPPEFAPGETLTPQLVVAGITSTGIPALAADVALVLERIVSG